MPKQLFLKCIFCNHFGHDGSLVVEIKRYWSRHNESQPASAKRSLAIAQGGIDNPNRHRRKSCDLGAWAMTTNFLKVRFALSTLYCHGICHGIYQAKVFCHNFPVCPYAQLPSPQNRKFYVYCRLAVSEISTDSQTALRTKIWG